MRLVSLGVNLLVHERLEAVERNPDHPEMLRYAHLETRATNRQRVGERRDPDVDIDAAGELRQLAAAGALPIAGAVGFEDQHRAVGSFEDEVAEGPIAVERDLISTAEISALKGANHRALGEVAPVGLTKLEVLETEAVRGLPADDTVEAHFRWISPAPSSSSSSSWRDCSQ